MPYKSEAQRKYFNANREKLESQGVDVNEWNKASKGKKLPEKTNDSEKKAFVRQLISYLLSKKNNEANLNKPKVEPEKNKTESDRLTEKAAKLLNQLRAYSAIKKAGITDNIPEILGALGGGIVGGLRTPEVTNENNPIINRIRGDVYPKENARMQNILRGALTGLTGIVGGRAGHAAGTLLAKTPLVVNRFVSPGLQELIKQVVPKITMLGGAGVGGAGGLAGYDLLKNLAERSKDLGKSEKKSFADPRLYPGAQGIYTPKDMNLNNSSTGRAVNQAIPAANQSTLLDKFLDANRASNRQAISFGNTVAGGIGGGLLGRLAGGLLAKRLGGNLSPELIKRIGLGVGTGAGGAAGYVSGQRQINSNPYLKDPTYLKQGYVLSPAEKRAFIEMVKVARCWKGYEPVPGKKAYSDGSCRPVGSGDKKKKEKN